MLNILPTVEVPQASLWRRLRTQLRMAFSSRPFRDFDDTKLANHLWAIDSMLLRAIRLRADPEQLSQLEEMRSEIRKEMQRRRKP